MKAQTIAAEVNAAAARDLVPLSVALELTYRCNQECYYCYQGPTRRCAELTQARWSNVLDQLAEAGTLYLTVTGGEPLMRDDALSILTYARQRDFAVSLITNGSLLSKGVAGALHEIGVTDVGVSLLAADPVVHDRLAGLAGSFDSAIGAIRALRRKGVNVAVKHTVSAANFGEYRRLGGLAEGEGCLFECDSLVLPAVRGGESPHALSEEQQARFLADMGADSIACYLAPGDTSNLHCDAGRSLCGIGPSGDVYPCIQLQLTLGNLLKASFAEIWHGTAAREFREREVHDPSGCRGCEVRAHCSRCPGVAWMECGDWQGAAPSLCARARGAARSATALPAAPPKREAE